jgi:hypothetical protein
MVMDCVKCDWPIPGKVFYIDDEPHDEACFHLEEVGREERAEKERRRLKTEALRASR